MKILLDTHMIIWTIMGDAKLPEKAREIILNSENIIYFSVLSLWEIEIKRLLKPEKMPLTAEQVYKYCIKSGFKLAFLKEKSIFHLQNLVRNDLKPPHKDPFDKMLICQAITEDMKFLTHDSLIKDYVAENIIFV